MREVKLRIAIDEKTGKIMTLQEEVLGLSNDIDKQIYLMGIYNYLLKRACGNNFELKNKIEFKGRQDG